MSGAAVSATEVYFALLNNRMIYLLAKFEIRECLEKIIQWVRVNLWCLCNVVLWQPWSEGSRLGSVLRGPLRSIQIRLDLMKCSLVYGMLKLYLKVHNLHSEMYMGFWFVVSSQRSPIAD